MQPTIEIQCQSLSKFYKGSLIWQTESLKLEYADHSKGTSQDNLVNLKKVSRIGSHSLRDTQIKIIEEQWKFLRTPFCLYSSTINVTQSSAILNVAWESPEQYKKP